MKRVFALAIAILAASSATAQTATPIDSPVATVNLIRLEPVSFKLFKSDVERIESQQGKKLSIDERRQLLNLRIDEILFFQYCERERIIVSEGEIAQQIQKMKAQQVGTTMTDAEFELALRQQGIQISDLRSYVKKQILISRFLEAKHKDELAGLKEPTAEEIINAYELLKTKLVQPDAVRVSVIYVDTRGMSEADKAKARDTMAGFAQQLRANPGKFDELLLRGSNPAASYKATAQLIVLKTPEFLNVYGQRFFDIVFKQKAGEISDIIENEAGYQIVRVNEVFPGKLLALSDPIQIGEKATVLDYLKYSLFQQKQQELVTGLLDKLIKELRAQAVIKITDSLLSSF